MDQKPGWFLGFLPRNFREGSAWGRARILLLSSFWGKEKSQVALAALGSWVCLSEARKSG